MFFVVERVRAPFVATVLGFVKREDFAIYVYFEVNLPADALLKISNTLNITDEVLRYLLVKADDKARQALAEQKEREAKSESEEDN